MAIYYIFYLNLQRYRSLELAHWELEDESAIKRVKRLTVAVFYVVDEDIKLAWLMLKKSATANSCGAVMCSVKSANIAKSSIYAIE